MAIIDKLLELSDSGDFATEAGTNNVGDTIDLGMDGRGIGESKLYLHIVVETSGDGGAGTAGTTAFQLASDSTSSVATDGNQTIHFTSDVYLGTALDQGDHLVFPLPTNDVSPYERYLQLQLVQAVEGEDDLVCSAWISPFPGGTWKAYPQANVAV